MKLCHPDDLGRAQRLQALIVTRDHAGGSLMPITLRTLPKAVHFDERHLPAFGLARRHPVQQRAGRREFDAHIAARRRRPSRRRPSSCLPAFPALPSHRPAPARQLHRGDMDICEFITEAAACRHSRGEAGRQGSRKASPRCVAGGIVPSDCSGLYSQRALSHEGGRPRT